VVAPHAEPQVSALNAEHVPQEGRAIEYRSQHKPILLGDKNTALGVKERQGWAVLPAEGAVLVSMQRKIDGAHMGSRRQKKYNDVWCVITSPLVLARSWCLVQHTPCLANRQMK